MANHNVSFYGEICEAILMSTNNIWASSWDYGTYRIGDQRRLRRACASAQSHKSLRCSHMTYGSRQRVRPKIRHLAPTGWLCMRVWRMSLQRTKSTIISWAGSYVFKNYPQMIMMSPPSLFSSYLFHCLCVSAIPADEKKYTIYIASSSDNYIPLNGSLTLEQVNDKYWRVNKPLEMFYAFHRKTDSPKKNIEKWQ